MNQYIFLCSYFDKVYAFDIQDLAFKRSKPKFKFFDNIEFIKDSYENVNKYVSKGVDCFIYNLGFLPGSDHKIKTESIVTIKSIENNLKLLTNNGKIIITSYTIHDNGLEFNNIKNYLEKIKDNYNINIYPFDSINIIEINKKVL